VTRGTQRVTLRGSPAFRADCLVITEFSMRSRLVLVVVFLLGSFPAFAADDGPYLFDLLKQPSYLAAWKAMLKGESVPSWVSSYAKTFDGPSTPSTNVSVAGESYMLGYVCKAHDCGDNQFYVLFAPSGAQAWGLLITSGNQQWLGNPNDAIKTALQSGVQ
jgi:hypothetical protein